MDKFILKPHSFIDVITNSSSELFVHTGGKTVDLVREVINKVIEAHNLSNSSCLTLEDIVTVELAEDMKDGDDWGYGESWKKGDIIIRSTSDNSIPWGIMDFIENELDARRYHLG